MEALDPVGAAWWRFFGRTDPGFGFVDEETPEVSIGVVEGARGQGLGTAMLKALITEAESRGVPALTLSVERDNYAFRLYERLGFRPMSTVGGAVEANDHLRQGVAPSGMSD